MFSRIKKFSLGLMIAIFLFVSAAGVLTPAPAHAQMAVVVAEDVPSTIDKVVSSILSVVKAALLNAGVKAASYALRKVAYDSAVWVASGGKGQGALAFQNGFGSYLTDVANEAGGAAIDELSRENGFNLCKVPDIKVDLALRVGLRTQFGGAPKKPACNTADFYKNWSSGLSKFTKPGALTQAFNISLKTDDSDFGIYTDAQSKINQKIADATQAGILSRQEGQGYKADVDKVSGQIKNTAQDVKKLAGSLTADETVKANEATLNAALASGDIKVFPTVLSIFLSTLGSNIINNFQTKGMLPFGLCVGGYGGADCKSAGSSGGANGILSYSGEGVTSLGRAAAQSFFSYITTVQIKEPSRYDLISQLSSCPDTPGIYNCRMGEDLVNAVGQNMTIDAAIKAGILNGDKKLYSPADVKNNDRNCYQSGYCLGDVKTLRQVRILPLGFEIAIQTTTVDNPVKLRDVVAAFNDGNASSNKYYHLIDPNWVLKLPPVKCNALVNGATLLSGDTPNRLEDCVDLETCVSYNRDGTCADYGYCTAEKNTWKFPADSCDSQFATCRSYTNPSGQTVSYLLRTVDNGFCNDQNVGCQAYSLTQDASGWQAPKFDNTLGANTGIFFNNKVESNCPASSVGCSAFQVASSTSVQLNIRKAPDYLNCYDADTATPGVQWPQTALDVSNMQTDPVIMANAAECSKYAGVCAAEEQGCNWYTPVSGGGVRVPGKFTPAVVSGNQVTWNDQCDAKCVGYNSYREMPTNYSNGQDIEDIIPASGSGCAAADVGCTSFTNLSTAAGQAEQVVYFTNLRNCLKPDETPNGAKTYITYEGSQSAGFQLKTYSLLPDATGATSGGVINAPQYFYKDPTELAQMNNECTKARYASGTASLDCRQFNDEAGNIYYRLLSKTIPVTADCTPYRINEAAFYTDSLAGTATKCSAQSGFWDTSVVSAGQCQMCLSGGKYKNGSCIYEGLAAGVTNNAGVSQSCSAAADTCRAYKGNAGNNIQNVFYDNFENVSSTDNWAALPNSSMSWSTVSTHVGEHSLEFNGPQICSLITGCSYTGVGSVGRNLVIDIGKSYDLTFWAYSDVNSTSTVQIVPSDGSAVISFGTAKIVKGFWQQYHLGPFEYLANTTTAQLVFTSNLGNPSYLDNVRLVKVADYIYLDKKTLNVDPVCDSPTVGAALGCQAYTDPQNRTFFLTNFSFLCREGAIGCTGLFDTHNTPSPNADTYNVWFATTTISSISETRTVGGDSYTCKVPIGQKGCYVNITGHSIADILASVTDGSILATNSTITIATDTPSTTPIYLVADQAATCSEADLGCTYAGSQIASSTTGGWDYVTTTIKNDPSQYNNTLCQKEAVGCNVYTSGQEINYFKDPSVSGGNICTYQTDVPYSIPGGYTKRVNGWFWKGSVGICANNGSKCTKGTLTDCASGVVCESEPCYPVYGTGPHGAPTEIAADNYDLKSFGDIGYENFVGECPADQDRCTQFVDHADKDKSYYLIKDEKVSQGDCSGQVSQKSGCALFDEVDNSTKSWHTTTTYADSDSKDGKLVSPISDAGNDANTLIKVVQDHDCGQWLACGSSYATLNEATGLYKPVCNGIMRCSPSSTASGSCAPTTSAFSGKQLTPEAYAARSVGWASLDYDGFSLLNTYPVEELSQINASSTGSDWRLAKIVSSGCVTDSDCAGNSICLNSDCVTGPSGEINQYSMPSHFCRAYPEATSPFPNTTRIRNSQGFVGANICNQDNSNDCECDYTKVNYGDLIKKYWSYTSIDDSGLIDSKTNKSIQNQPISNAPTGICFSGSWDSKNSITCTSDSDCQKSGKTGICQLKKDTHSYLGWRGFCIEPDPIRHVNADPAENQCLTWYPVEQLAGAADPNSQDYGAGYQTAGVDYYCLQARPAGSPPPDMTITFGAAGLQYNCGGVTCFGTDQFNQTYDTDYGYGNAATTSNGSNLWGVSNRVHLNVSGNSVGWSLTRSYDSYNGYNTAYPTNIPSGYDAVKQQDIERIEITVTKSLSEGAPSSGGNLAQPADSVPHPIYYIYPNDFSSIPKPQVYYTGLQDSPAMAAATGFYNKNENQPVMVFSNNYSIDSSQSQSSGANLTDQGEINYQDASWPNKQGIKGNFFDLQGTTANQLWDTSGGQYVNPVATLSNADLCPVQKNKPSNYRGIWSAIKFNFDPNKKTLNSIDLAYCDGDYGGGGINSQTQGRYVQYSIKFILRSTCDEVAKVGGDTDQSPSNAARTIAWTNRLWQGSLYKLINLPYDYSISSPPFGYTDIPDDKSLGIYGPQSIFNCLPHGASTANCKAADGTSVLQNAEIPSIGVHPFNKGAPYSCFSAGCQRSDGTTLIDVKEADGQTDKWGGDRLAELFANTRDNLAWNTDSYLTMNNSVMTNQTNVISNDGTKVPRIRALDNCAIAYGVLKCSEAATSSPFSITPYGMARQNSGDVVINNPSPNVALDFFVYADKDQMPVRNIKVDWAPGQSPSQSMNLNGFFRNDRGLQSTVCVDRVYCALASDHTQKTGGACKQNSDCQPVEQCVDANSNPPDFGHIKDQTCNNAYFHTEYLYTCNPSGLPVCQSTTDSNCFATSTSSYCPSGFTGGCCIFKPKVTVKDNWGWCNGGTPGSISSPGCYPQFIGGGCYDSSWSGGPDACTSVYAGTSSSIRIIIPPSS